MGVEGSLAIRIGSIAGKVSEVEIASSRRVDACRVLVGKSVEEALEVIPLLFSVCAQAQSVAALEACEGALGVVLDDQQRRARELFVAVEAVDNHARQIAFEWTTRLGAQPAVGLARALCRAGDELVAGTGAPRRHAVLGGVSLEPAADLAERAGRFRAEVLALTGGTLPDSADALGAWASGSAPAQRAVSALFEQGLASLGRSRVPLLPPLEPEWFAEQAAGSASFPARPEWKGRPAETGAVASRAADPLPRALLARYGNSLVTRFVARVAELETLAERAVVLARTLGPAAGGRARGRDTGRGAAVVSTARGQLAHVVRVESGRVADYLSVAPTEWNFHPAGPLVAGLVGSSSDDIERRAALLIAGLDPCVGYSLAVTEGGHA